MECHLLSMLALSCVCLLGLVRPGSGDPSMGGGGDEGVNSIGRPSRPQVFSTPEELTNYLKQVSNYFAIASRPRFGKRVAPTPQFRASMNALLANQLSDDSVDSKEPVETSFGGVATPGKTSTGYRYPAPNGELYQLLFPYDK